MHGPPFLLWLAVPCLLIAMFYAQLLNRVLAFMWLGSVTWASFFTTPGDDYASLQALVNLTSNKQAFAGLHFSDSAFFDPVANVVGTLDFVDFHQFQRQPYVANGYFGARVPNLGHGFTYDTRSNAPDANSDDLKNGWPMFNDRYAGAFVAGFYDSQPNTTSDNFGWISQYGWDSFISAVPQWTTLPISLNGFTLDPQKPKESWGTISQYSQSLSMANGVVTTKYTWQDLLNVTYEVSANKGNVNAGQVHLTVKNPSSAPVEITVTDVLDYLTSQRCQFVSLDADEQTGLSMVVSPDGLPSIFAAIHSVSEVKSDGAFTSRSRASGTFASREFVITIPAGQSADIVKKVGIVSTDLQPNKYKKAHDVLLAAKRATQELSTEDYHEVHNTAWKKTLGKQLEVEFPDSPMVTLASRASIYHLSANMREDATGVTAALSVAGLSSDSYGGQVFWDTDLWMLMGILPFHPEISKSLLNYRIHTRAQAIKNIDSPTKFKPSFKGTIYPWTSGRFGNCTATGPCYDYEYHVTANIAYSAFKLFLSGAVDEAYLEDVVYPIVHDAALLFSTYVELDEDSLTYTTQNLTDPDEYAEFVDNGAYTNAAISACMKWATIIANHLGKSTPESFKKILGHVNVPVSEDDERIVLEYTNMESSIGVKQADVIMMTYPLSNELISTDQAIANLEYYASKQVSYGPAMTFPIFSIVSAAMLDTGCADESYLLKSIRPFLRGPFAQFSEQSNDNYLTNGGTHPAFPFLTAHGGFLQVILLGVFGMRFNYEIENDKIVRVLQFDAHNLSLLPNGAHIEGVRYLNHTLSLTLKDLKLTIKNEGITEGLASEILEVKIVFSPKNGVQHSKTVAPQGTVVFEVPTLKKASAKSLTECGLAEFANVTAGVFGDVIEQVGDGVKSTHWQSNSSGKSKILVDLKASKNLKSGVISWGDTPAKELKIYSLSSTAAKSFPGLKLNADILAQVSLGADVHEKFAYLNPKGDLIEQESVFQEVFSTPVEVNVPFNAAEIEKIQLQKTYNTTNIVFDESVSTRFLLVEFSGVYTDSEAGAKIYDMNFY